MHRTAGHVPTHGGDVVTHGAATPTGDVPPRTPSRAADELFAGVSHAVRLQLELVVRSATDQDLALVSVIALLVDEDSGSAKCTAIVSAFRSNPALNRQWQNAWNELRV